MDLLTRLKARSRVSTSFGLIIAMFACLSLFSFHAGQESTAALQQLTHLQERENLYRHAEKHIIEGRYLLWIYLETGDRQRLIRAFAFFETAQKSLIKMAKETTNLSKKAKIQKMGERLVKYKQKLLPLKEMERQNKTKKEILSLAFPIGEQLDATGRELSKDIQQSALLAARSTEMAGKRQVSISFAAGFLGFVALGLLLFLSLRKRQSAPCADRP